MNHTLAALYAVTMFLLAVAYGVNIWMRYRREVALIDAARNKQPRGPITWRNEMEPVEYSQPGDSWLNSRGLFQLRDGEWIPRPMDRRHRRAQRHVKALP